MAKLVYLTLALIWVSLIVCQINGSPTSDEEQYYDRELNRELINWLSSMHYAQAQKNPCRYYPDNSLNAPIKKRNSELINSILSLPRGMNAAGK